MSFADRIKALVKHPKAKPVVDKSPPTEAGFRLVERALRPAEGPVDLGLAVRKKLRELRARCEHTNVMKREGGREICRSCHDCFPCRSESCGHLDCIERRHELWGKGFPRTISHCVRVLSKGHTSGDDCFACAVAPEDHYEYNVNPNEDPEKWITAIPLAPR